MKLIKTESPNFENMDLLNHHLAQDLMSEIFDSLKNELEDYFIVGLKRKGFDFKHKVELEAFIKEHCRCEDNVDLEVKVYYVDNMPFCLHNYKSEILQMPSIIDGEYKVTANLGTYTYL
tara:strand:+ start:5750 stop:6106 length:357 start_codon:yes stop_codon:yes gene_type:complete